MACNSDFNGDFLDENESKTNERLVKHLFRVSFPEFFFGAEGYIYPLCTLFEQMAHAPLHPWFKDLSEIFLEFILSILA